MSDNESGFTTSLWMGMTDMPRSEPLGHSLTTDVCIVGAGMAGLSTAYCLIREGKSVVVLDDGPIGGGMTERTTAHLSNALDDGYAEVERLHGEQGAGLAAGSHTAAIDRIETIIKEEKIACDFERLDGYLFAPADSAHDVLEPELLAALRSGLVHVERLERAPVIPLTPGPCLRFPRQAQFHPLKYLAGLARAILARGGDLYTGTHVRHVIGGPPARIETSNGQVITAEAVVVATNTPIVDMVTVHTKQAPYTTYVLGIRVPRNAVPKALYWDMEEPYHYVRLYSPPDADYDILISGGEDHKTGQADDGDVRYARLERWTRTRFPMIGDVLYRWSGQVMEPVDGLAFIGRNPGDAANVYIATGDSGMGMTHGTIAGILIGDLIMERDCAWAPLYDPSRKTLGAVGTYAKETLNMAAQYTEWVTSGDVDSVEEIANDSGSVIRRGLTKVAVYRDEQGTVHERSAVCTHLGCIVGWNKVEKTWDCPCHGSRYDKFGKVINGPANEDLARLE